MSKVTKTPGANIKLTATVAGLTEAISAAIAERAATLEPGHDDPDGHALQVLGRAAENVARTLIESHTDETDTQVTVELGAGEDFALKVFRA